MKRRLAPKKQPAAEITSILIASENAAQRQYLTVIFEGTGYEVSTSEDSMQILRAIKQHVPHLIILDIMTSGMDSLEIIALLRLRWSIPIILISPIADPSAARKALDYGADDYVVDPFSAAELVARARAILRRTCRWS